MADTPYKRATETVDKMLRSGGRNLLPKGAKGDELRKKLKELGADPDDPSYGEIPKK